MLVSSNKPLLLLCYESYFPQFCCVTASAVMHIIISELSNKSKSTIKTNNSLTHWVSSHDIGTPVSGAGYEANSLKPRI